MTKLYRLGDGCAVKHGYAFKGEHMVEGGSVEHPIVVNIGNFRYSGGFRFESTKIQRYTGSYPKSFELNSGDVLVVMTCQTAGGEILGLPGRIPSDGQIYLHNQRMGLLQISQPNELCLSYLYYLFLSPLLNRHLVASASGAKILHTAPSRIEEFRWARPPVEAQRQISAALSAYDDLIENNAKRIRLLEEICRLVYREWFQDFRYPGSQGKKLVSTSVGRVPSGWKVMPASEAIELDPTTRVPREGLKPFLPMGSLSNDSMVIREIEEREGNSGAKFKNGDTLFARITPCLENGKTAYVQFLPDEDAVAFGSTEFIVMRGRLISPEMVYLLARTPEFRAHAIKSMSGASGRQRVQERCFDNYMLAVPPKDLVQSFSKLTAPMFRAIHLHSERNRRLQAMRDILLPKLISGEIDVSRLPLPPA